MAENPAKSYLHSLKNWAVPLLWLATAAMAWIRVEADTNLKTTVMTETLCWVSAIAGFVWFLLTFIKSAQIFLSNRTWKNWEAQSFKLGCVFILITANGVLLFMRAYRHPSVNVADHSWETISFPIPDGTEIQFHELSSHEFLAEYDYKIQIGSGEKKSLSPNTGGLTFINVYFTPRIGKNKSIPGYLLFVSARSIDLVDLSSSKVFNWLELDNIPKLEEITADENFRGERIRLDSLDLDKELCGKPRKSIWLALPFNGNKYFEAKTNLLCQYVGRIENRGTLRFISSEDGHEIPLRNSAGVVESPGGTDSGFEMSGKATVKKGELIPPKKK